MEVTTKVGNNQDQSLIHLRIQSIILACQSSHSQAKFYLKIQNVGLPDQKSHFNCQTRKSAGVTCGQITQFEWAINKQLTIANPFISILIFQQHILRADCLITKALIPLVDILTHLLQSPNTAFGVGVESNYTLSIIFQQSLLDIDLQLSKPLIEDLNNVQKSLNLFFHVDSPYFSMVEPSIQLLSILCDKLQSYGIAPKQLVNLIHLMKQGVFLFEQVEVLPGVSSDNQLVIERVFQCFQQVLTSFLIPYTQSHHNFLLMGLTQKNLAVMLQYLSNLQQAFQELGNTLNFQVEQTAEMNKLNKLLAQLHPVPYNSGPLCLPGTRTEVLQKILNWTTQHHTQLFWLYGQAGTGKSAIAQSVFNQLRQTNMMRAFYTCSKTNAQLQNPLNVLPTICFQLCNVHKEYAKYISNQIDNDLSLKEGLGHIATQLESLFIKPLQHVSIASETGLLIILDALDECGSESDQICLLRSLIKVLHACPAIKLLITSRNEAYIEEHLAKLSAFEYQLNCNNSWLDICFYWQTHISGLFQEQFLKSHPGLVKTLTDYSQGLFIWSQTVYNCLKTNDSPELVLDHILKISSVFEQDHVSHLYKLYYTIIDRAVADNSDNLIIYQCVVGSILLCGEPLSIDTLIQLLHPVISWNGIKKAIQSLMALLSINSNRKVQILHPSLADYILSETSRGTSFYINALQMHSFLYQQSGYKLLSQLKFNICDLRTSHLRNNQVHDLDQRISLNISQELQYSVQYWIYHLIRSSDLDKVEDNHILSQLLIGWTTIHWIECMSLLGKLKFCLTSLQQLQVWLKKEISSNFVVYIHDICNFITKFYIPIQVSSPHIYLSALPFCPKQSIIYKKCTTLLHNKVKVLNSPEFWSVHNLTISKDECSCIIFQPQSNIICLGSYDGTVEFWDSYSGCSSGYTLKAHIYPVSGLAISPNKSIMYSSCIQTITTWDLSTGQQLFQPLHCHSSSINCLTISPNGQYLVSGSSDKSLIIWDISQTFPSLKHTMLDHNSKITSFAVSENEAIIICGLFDKTLITVWDVYKGKLIKSIKPDGRITALVHFPNSPLIATGFSDFSVSIWNLETGQCVFGPFTCHTAAVMSINIFPDEKKIITGGSDGTLRIWKADSDIMLSNHNIFAKSNLGHESLLCRKVQFREYPDMFDNLNVTSDGWVTHHDRLILWVPPLYRQSLVSPQILCTSSEAPNQTLYLDWTKFVQGDHWCQILD
ncbi:hypothetical protein BDN72DRAFT_925749 [Pluteus cervinus]|uniref:Uncharacterized protein n=1 Tax=Pluteus cervinus TaxID=181527 RepID=A0ACD3AFB0_9AGAR|nr:hypothetical protein BDN72DRAFT_925749 [Pluteus cervinus]